MRKVLCTIFIFCSLFVGGNIVHAEFIHQYRKVNDNFYLVGSVYANHNGIEYFHMDSPNIYFDGISNWQPMSFKTEIKKFGNVYQLFYSGKLKKTNNVSLTFFDKEVHSKNNEEYKELSGSFYFIKTQKNIMDKYGNCMY